MIADKYHGAVAIGYEHARSGKPKWAAEQRIIEDVVTEGPVLDCPVGTGRYIPIYRKKQLDYVGVDISPDMLTQARQKHPQGQFLQGSIFDLPWADDFFAVAVCTRLMNWLTPEEVIRAMAELKRVSRSQIVSISIGSEGHRKGRTSSSYVHSEKTWVRAMNGSACNGRIPIQQLDTHEYAAWWLE